MSTSHPVLVDLVTPPPSPKMGLPDDRDGVSVKRERNPQTTYDDNDEPVVVNPRPKKTRAAEPVAGAFADDACVLTGSMGDNPLIDYAHARWHCCAVPIKRNLAVQHCPNCYCVICDVPADECSMWEDHCSADPLDSDVRKQRAFFLKSGGNPAHNCFLQQLKQIYPTEVDVPLENVTLKTYQRQCLSWMLDRESTGFTVSRLLSNPLEDDPDKIYGGILALEMGMGKTICVIALCKANPMPTLVVAPPLNCVQWVSQIKQVAPEMSVKMLYCTSQAKIEHALLTTDVLVVSPTSNLLASIMQRVRRVVVDESHEVCSSGHSSGSAIKFVHNLREFTNAKNIWLVSGTPFGSSEKISDPAFARQLRVLLRRQSQHGIHIKTDASTADVKALVMRYEKKQTFKTANGSSMPFMSIPDIEFKTLEVGLCDRERELYNIAACIDGWNATEFRVANKKHANQIFTELATRFALRKLVLGERIAEFKAAALRRLDEQFYCADSEAPDLFFAKVNRMTYRIDECCKHLMDSSSKIDAVLDEIKSLRELDPKFKAVVITESEGAGRYMKRKLGDRVGVMHRAKGRTSVREQEVLLNFQFGKYDLLVCSFESVRIGTNLDQAGAIYFVDTSIDETEYKQACARISRCGTKQSKLTATFVYVKETLSEEIFKYHEDRRAGRTIEEAAARFEEDDCHDFSDPVDFHRIESGRAFDSMKFSVQRTQDRLPSDPMSSDMNIHDMFDMICDSESNTDEYHVTLTFAAGHKRPACYDVAKQIIVTSKVDSEHQIRFDVPPRHGQYGLDPRKPELLSATVNMSDEAAKIFETVSSWQKDSASAAVHITMLLSNGQVTKLYDQIRVIRASCSSCKWCGWRKIHNCDAPFVGCGPILAHVNHQMQEHLWPRIPNKKLLTVSSIRGSLHADLQYDDSSRKFVLDAFAPVSAEFKEYVRNAYEDKKKMGVVVSDMRYDMLNAKFFETRSDVYQKVLVKLQDASINDTIRFEYKGRRYEAFIREMIPVGLDWYAVSHVVESEKQQSPIIIDEHTFVDMKRVVKVGGDAFSIKDIIRMLRGNTGKTERLKSIMLRNDIPDEEKLRLASALL